MFDWFFYGLLLIFFIGLILISISYFFDTDDGVELSPTSPIFLSIYAVWFATIGLLLHVFTDLKISMIVFMAFFVALVPYSIAYIFLSVFLNRVSTNITNVHTPPIGVVTIAINPPYTGQVSYEWNGYRHYARAVADEPIPESTFVRILTHGQIFRVEKHTNIENEQR